MEENVWNSVFRRRKTEDRIPAPASPGRRRLHGEGGLTGFHPPMQRYIHLNITTKLTVLLYSAIAVSAPAVRAETVTVFAAASLTDSLKLAAERFEEQSHDKIEFNFAGSSLLARQIEEGAPADIFFSADAKWMDELEKRGLIAKETRRDRLSNSLVIIVPKDSTLSITSPRDLVQAVVGRIALADPEAVPAGIYAREYLRKQNLWTAVEPKVIPTANVRAALAAVASGNVEAGIVYKTDAAISKQVRVAYEIPARDGPDIVYPVAAVKGPAKAAARKFLDYLNSMAGGDVFAGFGFIVRSASQ
jgi:molybdate transport system substrate-binding protein